MFVNIQQELLKNFFGYNEQRRADILRNAGRIQRETILFNLSGLVVSVVVDYWSLKLNRKPFKRFFFPYYGYILRLRENSIIKPGIIYFNSP